MFSEAFSSFSDSDELDSFIISSEKSDFKEVWFLNVWDAKKHLFVEIQMIENFWKDDINYCYKHAAQSNYNFDWVCMFLNKIDIRNKLRFFRK